MTWPASDQRAAGITDLRILIARGLNVTDAARTLGIPTSYRIEPGGSYAHDNIRPACRACQNTQGALITWERRYQWRGWWEEAQAAGIEWDGSM